jgi:hypothetical protein
MGVYPYQYRGKPLHQINQKLNGIQRYFTFLKEVVGVNTEIHRGLYGKMGGGEWAPRHAWCWELRIANYEFTRWLPSAVRIAPRLTSTYFDKLSTRRSVRDARWKELGI